jgi:cell division septal protein FtsQ
MAEKKRKAAPRAAAKPARAKATQAKRAPRLLAYWPRFLFIIPVALVLWVPSYNRTEPALGGVPFFYWYQLGLILAGAALVSIVYLLETRVTGVTPRTGASVDPGATGDVL